MEVFLRKAVKYIAPSRCNFSSIIGQLRPISPTSPLRNQPWSARRLVGPLPTTNHQFPYPHCQCLSDFLSAYLCLSYRSSVPAYCTELPETARRKLGRILRLRLCVYFLCLHLGLHNLRGNNPALTCSPVRSCLSQK